MTRFARRRVRATPPRSALAFWNAGSMPGGPGALDIYLTAEDQAVFGASKITAVDFGWRGLDQWRRAFDDQDGHRGVAG